MTGAGPGLQDRIVLVTGAGGGIGRSVVARLLLGGATVVACDRPGSKVADRLGTLAGGTRLSVGEADVSDPETAAAWVEGAVAAAGGVDALVNVAGYWMSRPFLEIGPGELEEMVRANLATAFYPSQGVARHMVAKGSGSIVHFASTAGEYGSISPGAHYAAAKGGVIALTKSMARELSPLGVRVNAISPGPIDTSALSGGAPVDTTVTAQRTLFGRLGRPEEIADAVAFLAGGESTFITGHILGVNGGSRL